MICMFIVHIYIYISCYVNLYICCFVHYMICTHVFVCRYHSYHYSSCSHHHCITKPSHQKDQSQRNKSRPFPRKQKWACPPSHQIWLVHSQARQDKNVVRCKKLRRGFEHSRAIRMVLWDRTSCMGWIGVFFLWRWMRKGGWKNIKTDRSVGYHYWSSIKICIYIYADPTFKMFHWVTDHKVTFAHLNFAGFWIL